MKTIFAATIVALCLCGCGEQDVGAPIDRKASPEAAFAAAQAALKRKDHRAFVDTLTDSAVRTQMYSSAAICLASLADNALLKMIESTGCNDTMSRYGWRGNPKDFGKSDLAGELSAVTDPRALTRELEENHDRNNTPSSFVWDFLADVSLSDVVVEGDRARGKLRWNDGDATEVLFERDSTGWRFDPFQGLAEPVGEDEGEEDGEEP